MSNNQGNNAGGGTETKDLSFFGFSIKTWGAIVTFLWTIFRQSSRIDALEEKVSNLTKQNTEIMTNYKNLEQKSGSEMFKWQDDKNVIKTDIEILKHRVTNVEGDTKK